MKELEINVLEHGVKSDPELLQNEAIQRIIDAAPAGSRIVFPKGQYVASKILLRSNLTIVLEKDAFLLGSLNFNDYAESENVDFPLYQDASHAYFQPSLILGDNVHDVRIMGEGTIDMRSVWDEENVRVYHHEDRKTRAFVYRGAKAITFKESENIVIEGIRVLNATDLALYFVSSSHIVCHDLYLKVHIDGISPDNCKDVEVYDCEIWAGDDGLVPKSTFNLNRFDCCEDLNFHDLKIRSECNAIKIGTETIGAFRIMTFRNIMIKNTRITGISVETVDGAPIEDVLFENIEMTNVGTPLFVVIGDRLRTPGEKVAGSIKNLTFRNIVARGPYEVYDCFPWTHAVFVEGRSRQFPGFRSKSEREPVGTWQTSSLLLGMEGHPIENLTLENIDFKLDGGVSEYPEVLPPAERPYPEVINYGKISPSSGFVFTHIKGLTLKDVNVDFYYPDQRKICYFDDVTDANGKEL